MRQPFQRLLDREAPVIGTWSQFRDPEPVDILAHAGFDFTIIDTEHGCFGLETAETLVRACEAGELVPLVRVPANEGWMITKALDIGAAAVVVPRIATPEAAARAVAAARYGVEGGRGACPCIRAGGQFVEDWPAFEDEAATTGIIALIETPEAIERIEMIAAVEGLKALLAGPFDLAVAMGLRGDHSHPLVQDAFERVRQAAGAHDVPLIMPIFRPSLAGCRELMAGWMAKGVTLFTVGTDKLLFADHCRRYVRGLRTA
jgi:4-hydroxy-2-oxoheptanedioate aldolase